MAAAAIGGEGGEGPPASVGLSGGKLAGGGAGGNGVHRTDLHIGRAEDDDGIIQGRGVTEELIALSIGQRHLCAGSLTAGIGGDYTLLGLAEALEHEGGAGADEGSAGNGGAQIIVQDGGIAPGRAADSDAAAGDIQRTVCIQPVAVRRYLQIAAGNG